MSYACRIRHRCETPWTCNCARTPARGLAPLTPALRRPTVRLPPGTICPVQVYVLPLFLIDRGGHVIRPVLPTNECGQPQPQFLARFWRTLSQIAVGFGTRAGVIGQDSSDRPGTPGGTGPEGRLLWPQDHGTPSGLADRRAV
jgi:hypothetical protein